MIYGLFNYMILFFVMGEMGGWGNLLAWGIINYVRVMGMIHIIMLIPIAYERMVKHG